MVSPARPIDAFTSLAAWRLILLLLFSGWAVSAAQAEQGGRVVQRLEVAEWPPLITQTRADGGVITALVREVFARQGIDIEVVYHDSWSAIESVVIDQQQGVSFAWRKNQERPTRWHFSKPLLVLEAGLWVREDFNKSVESFADLRGMLVGVSKGYSYGDDYERYKDTYRRAELIYESKGFELLANGRIDVFISARPVGRYYVESKPQAHGALFFLPFKLLGLEPLHLVCSRDYEACDGLIQAFDQALGTLPKTSTAMH